MTILFTEYLCKERNFKGLFGTFGFECENEDLDYFISFCLPVLENIYIHFEYINIFVYPVVYSPYDYK